MSRVFLFAALLSAIGCRQSSGAAPSGLVDDGGTTIALATPPVRIVSLIPATTELVFALGAGGLLVGRTSWCDYPEAATLVPDLGNGIEPNVEAVVGSRPDLVLLYRSASNRVAADRFRDLGIPTLELATDRMADFERITRLLGAVLARSAAAESLVARTFRDLAAAKAGVPASSRPTVFLLAWDRPPMTLGRGSFLSEILESAGAQNVFADVESSSAPISIEAVAARNPDFILTTPDGDPAIASRSEWRAVRAVREKRFLRVTGSEFNRPSPRIGEAVRQLAAALAAAAGR